MLYDAAIIGAGPAGCAAAIALARSGFQVLLIEALPFPRHRPGESLHPGVEPIFEALGVAEQVNAAGFLRHMGHRVAWEPVHKPVCEPVCEPANGLVNGPAQSVQLQPFGRDARGEWLGYQAERAPLDAILLRQAIAQGTTVWQPCRVRAPVIEGGQLVGLETDHGPVQARYILDGTGRSQWLSRQLGLRFVLHSHALRVRYGYAVCSAGPNPYDVPLMQRDTDGWTWLARVSPNRCAWVRLRFDGGDPGGDWRPPQLDFYPAGPSKGEDVTWRICEDLAGDSWFLLGDAAFILDPAASHGVLKALMTGMQAAHLVTDCLRGRLSGAIAARQYAQWLRTWFEGDARRLRELYSSPQDPSPTI
ncbi:MAG: NAD(P)/FAD-dependent oxidoreductase [Elainellaceae cyanobacterium]